MSLSFCMAIKDFLGVYALTPFEKNLLARLGEALTPAEREALTWQVEHFTTVRRLIRHIDVPRAHGFTNFHTVRFGKDITGKRQTKRFSSGASHATLATAHVVFDGGEIDVKFVVVRDVLFTIDYRSPQKIYYPPDDYQIESVTLWPKEPPETFVSPLQDEDEE